MRMRTPLALALAAGGLSLAACADDLYGPYGYGGVGVSYGAGYGGYYGSGYGYSPYYSYGAYDPFGWYGDYYYPGVGVYVYDSYRRPHRWDGNQERYWTERRSNWQSHSGRTWNHENWSGWTRSGRNSGSGDGGRHHQR